VLVSATIIIQCVFADVTRQFLIERNLKIDAIVAHLNLLVRYMAYEEITYVKVQADNPFICKILITHIE